MSVMRCPHCRKDCIGSRLTAKEDIRIIDIRDTYVVDLEWFQRCPECNGEVVITFEFDCGEHISDNSIWIRESERMAIRIENYPEEYDFYVENIEEFEEITRRFFDFNDVITPSALYKYIGCNEGTSAQVGFEFMFEDYQSIHRTDVKKIGTIKEEEIRLKEVKK